MIIKTKNQKKVSDEEFKVIEEDALKAFQRLQEEKKKMSKKENKKETKEQDFEKNPLPATDEELDPIASAWRKYKTIGATGTTVLEYLLMFQKGKEVKSSTIKDDLNLTASNLSHSARRLEEGNLISRGKGYSPEIGTIMAMILRTLVELEQRVDKIEKRLK